MNSFTRWTRTVLFVVVVIIGGVWFEMHPIAPSYMWFFGVIFALVGFSLILPDEHSIWLSRVENGLKIGNQAITAIWVLTATVVLITVFKIMIMDLDWGIYGWVPLVFLLTCVIVIVRFVYNRFVR